MEIDFKSTKDNHNVTINLDKDDVNDAREILRMMEEEYCPRCKCPLNNGWKILQKYWAMAREAIIERIKKVSATESDMRMCAIRGSVLKGFDEAISIPQRVVDRSHEYLKENKNIKEGDNNADE